MAGGAGFAATTGSAFLAGPGLGAAFAGASSAAGATGSATGSATSVAAAAGAFAAGLGAGFSAGFSAGAAAFSWSPYSLRKRISAGSSTVELADSPLGGLRVTVRFGAMPAPASAAP